MRDPSRDERIHDALAEWRERRQADPAADSQQFLAGHPDLAGDLAEHLLAERLLTLALPDEVVEAPRVLGDFRILGELGRGGMGIVYEAEQVSMRRKVALKVLHPAVTLHPQAVERFRREAQAAGRLHHTNIVPVFAMGEASGCWFYAMELVRGRTLADICSDLRRLGAGPAEGTPPPPSSGLGSSSGGHAFYVRVARAFAGVAEALHAAHLANVVHRDVKPSNLILDDDGTLKLTDFGLARMEGELPTVTLTGAVLGTPAYMSPEQVRGGGAALDARTDVYSLGATLYEVLTLRPPFRGRPEELLPRILRGGPPSPRAFERRIPRDLETILMKALEREPERRYRTAADLAHDLTHFAEGVGIQARRASLAVRALRALKRHRKPALAVSALLLAGGVTGAALSAASRSDAARARIAYDDTIRYAGARLAEQAWFGDGLLQRLNGETRAALGSRLAAAALERPTDPAPAVLAALLPEVPYGERLDAIDAAHRRGLAEPVWRWGRAYLLQRGGRGDDAGSEVGAVEHLPLGEAWTALLAGYVRLLRGDRPGALAAFGLLIDDPLAGSGHPARPFALYARGYAREQERNLNQALEDYAAFEPAVEVSWPHVRMRMSSVWWQLGERKRARGVFEGALATVRQTGRKDALGYVQIVDVLRGWGLPWAWQDETTRAMVEDKPAFAESWARRANCLWSGAAPDMAEVLRLQQKACDLAATDAQREEHLLALAMMHVMLNRHKEAAALADLALALAPGSSEASVVKARALSGLGRTEEAATLARTALARDPRAATLHHAGPILHAAGAVDEAIEVMRRAIAADPSCVSCRRNLLRFLRGAQRWPELERAARELIALMPDDPGPWSCLSSACAEREDWQGYLEASQALTRLQPQDRDWWSNLGDALSRVGKPTEALTALRHANQLGLFDRNTVRIAMECYRGLDRVDDAVAEVKKAVAAGVADDVVYDEGVGILREVGRLEEALALADEGRAKYPRASVLLSQRTATLERMGRDEEALASGREMLALDETDGQAWVYVANALWRLDRREEALETAREGVARTGATFATLVRYVYGQLLRGAQRPEEALEAWAPLLTSAPQSPATIEFHLQAICHVGTVEHGTRLIEAVRSAWGAREGTLCAFHMVVLAQKKAASGVRADGGAFAQGIARHASGWNNLAGSEGLYILAVGGKRAEAEAAAARMAAPTSGAEAYLRAHAYAALALREQALEYLRLAKREGCRAPHAGEEPAFAPFAQDAEFRELFAGMR